VQGLLEAARPELDAGRGVWGTIYDASDPSNITYRAPCVLGDLDPSLVMHAHQAATPEDIQRTMRTATCGTASELLGPAFERFSPIQDFGHAYGVYDSLGINARDSSGKGMMIVSFLPRKSRLGPRKAAHWERVAAHMTTGFRLRAELTRRLEAADLDTAEAVLAPDGKLQHASGPAAATTARQLLARAALAIERARGPLRSDDAERAVKEWRGLVAARWSLIDYFDTDGRRYLVARENSPHAPGPEVLTVRERQVVAFAALGHSNKLIAYELGIAHSTVRVLIARAAAKLGVASREEVICRFVAAPPRRRA
jgi:DNA-binding NarL/FixJ family response regulator